MSLLEAKSRVQCLVGAKPGEFFTRKTAREVIGNDFPITGAKGETKGVGKIVEAVTQDGGRTLALTIEVPEYLTPNLELDAGISMGEPYPSRSRPVVG